MEIDKDNLEKALGENGSSPKAGASDESGMSKEMEIGFHEGALNTLNAERLELYRVIQNVEKIMKIHIDRLKELGVKFEEPKK